MVIDNGKPIRPRRVHGHRPEGSGCVAVGVVCFKTNQGFQILEAEHHVRLAFQHARKHESSIVISVNEDKTVTEILPSSESITYALNNWGNEWKEVFKEASVSSAIVSKILSLSRHYDKEEITSQDLSRWLKSTERNGRRILTEMERIGIVEISGEEQSGGRGRPRKLYRFQLK